VLKEYGADFDRPDAYGNIPLITAIERGLPEVVKYLIESKAWLEAKDDEGDTALHAAVWHQNTDVVHMLCEAGADINTLDKTGKTPLENALSQKHMQITMTLLEFDAKGSSGSFEDTILRETSGSEDFQTTIRTFMQIQARHRASQHEHMSRIQAIAEELKCSICLHVVTMPTTVIPCHHSFCVECVKKMHKCPTCRSDITGRHNNFMLTNVSEKFSNDEPPAKRARAR
jgi:predicted Zn-ribbon and HTH transcriptional regulator